MNFDFSDELKQLRDQARRFLGERSAPKQVRRVLEGGVPDIDSVAASTSGASIRARSIRTAF